MLAALVGTPGIVGAADLAVAANGTPNMTVNVAAGAAFIKGTEATYQGVYHAFNDASVSLAIAASDPTNPRIDIVVAQVRDSNYSGSNDDFNLVVVTGTPAGAPAAPATPADSLVLARVAVAHSVTSIVAGNITDYRARSVAPTNAYKARARSSGNTVYSGTPTKIALASVDYDPNSNFATSRYTAPVAGYYDIRARLTVSGGYATNTSVVCLLYKNGTEKDRISTTTGPVSTIPLTLVSSDIYPLAAGDYIELYAAVASGSANSHSAPYYSSLAAAYHSAL